jgi:hypothetical protein
MSTRTNTITLVQSLLQINTSVLSSDDTGTAIDHAVMEFSKDRPFDVVDHFEGKDEYDYDLANLLSNWIENFSTVKEVEYPAHSQSAQMIEDIDWEVYKPDTSAYSLGTAASAATSVTMSTAANAVFFKNNNCVYLSAGTSSDVNWLSADGNTTSGVLTLKNSLSVALTGTAVTISHREVLRFPSYSPATTEIVRVIYTSYHTLSDSVDTIPASDYKAVSWLSAAYAAYMIAAKYAKSTDSSISADSVDYLTKVDQWQVVGDKYYTMYRKHLGLPADGSPLAASKTQDWDLFYSWGTDRLFHPRRWR